MTGLLAQIGLPFVPNAEQLRPFAAELWLVGGIIAVLICPFFATRRPNAASACVALVALAAALISLLVAGVSPVTADAPGACEC
jgi:hypothetical protein